jgi:ABC-2 type transport system ATP-binding protein
MPKETFLEVIDVFKYFKTVKAVDGLSFSVKEGQFLALLGPNGAGKTTMVEMIEGIQHPDHGEILIDGKKWLHHTEELHGIIGLSLQETRFIDKLNVLETLMLFASFYGLGKKRVEEVIDIVGLEEKRKAYVVNLSGGQRQRLALGIALLNKPRMLLLDEPTTGLDPNARREVWSILAQLKKESNTSMILTTHYMEEAEQLCDYIIIIDHGKILKQGTQNQLLNKVQDQKIVEFSLLDQIPQDLIDNEKYPFQIHCEKGMKAGIVVLNELNSELPEFLNYLRQNNLTLNSLESRRLSLDDLFIELTGRHLND